MADKPEFFVPIQSLLFKEPVTAGADIYTIATFVKFYRDCNEDLDPITVKAAVLTLNDTYYRIMDGRHRVIASILAGRKTILAVEER